MIRTIPEDKYKSVIVDKCIDITGFKSERYTWPNGHNSPSVLDTDAVHLNITSGGKFSSGNSPEFKFVIRGRENLLKLKEAVDFALEIDEEKDKNGKKESI